MDIELHYTEHGVGEPLILLHGNGEDSSYFEHQVPFLAERFRVIAVDTRGHGGSPRGTAPFTLAQFADDLAAFMDGLGIGSAHLLGFSDGGNIALLFALARPGRVKSLVLNGANLFPEGLRRSVRREIETEYSRAVAEDDGRQAALMRLMMDEPRIDPAALGALRIPTLVVAGTRDMILRDHTRLIARSIPGAELRFIEGTHFIAAERPDEFNRVVGDFLACPRGTGGAPEPLFTCHPAFGDDAMRLGSLVPGDAGALRAMTANPRVYEHEPTFLHELRHEDKAEAIARMDEECFATRKSIHLAVRLASEPEALAGIVEFYNYEEGLAKASIGYRFDERHWGKGIATHAVGLAVRYLVERAGIGLVTAHVMVGNGASGAVLLKNGFVPDAGTFMEDWGFGERVEVHRFTLAADA